MSRPSSRSPVPVRVPAVSTDGARVRRAVTAPTSVLVVDDEPLLRDLYATALDRDPDFHVVGSSGDGADAVATAADLQPDLVLLDVRIPGLQGVELVHAFREVAPASRVVMISGHATTTSSARLLAAGAWDVVRKGGTAAELCDVLRSVAHADAPPGDRRVARQPHARPVGKILPRESAPPTTPPPVGRRRIVAGWVVAIAVATAACLQGWAWQREVDVSASVAASAAVTLTAEQIDAHVDRRVAALDATASGLLGGTVDDDALAVALLPLEVPFAVLLAADPPNLLASLPPVSSTRRRSRRTSPTSPPRCGGRSASARGSSRTTAGWVRPSPSRSVASTGTRACCRRSSGST